jgi:proton glutamate symport protein
MNPAWLLSSWAIFSGIIAGCVIGLEFKELADHLTILAQIFLSLIQMCIIPIVITAVVSSLARLVARRISALFLCRLFMIFAVSLILASLLGFAAGVLGKPGVDLDQSARVSIGQMISQHEMEDTASRDDSAYYGVSGFLRSIVPSNIFTAFTKGQMLSIIFFCIVLGIALGCVRTPSGKAAISVMEALYDAFQKLFGWIMYLLPFGLCVLIATQISHSGLAIIKAMVKFIGEFYLCGFILVFFYHVLIWRRRGGSFISPLIALREPLAVSFGTSSSYAAMPSALRCLQDNLKVDKTTSNLVMPLGISLHPPANVMYFVFSIMFISQIYHVPLGAEGFMIALVGSIMASIGGATGVPGPGPLLMLALVLVPLGLPTQTSIILLIATFPIIDPMLALANIFANCTATVLLDEPK